MWVTESTIINKFTHKNLEESGSDMYSNKAVWKVKQIYSIFPSGFHCEKKGGGDMQSTNNKVENFNKEGNKPYNAKYFRIQWLS